MNFFRFLGWGETLKQYGTPEIKRESREGTCVQLKMNISFQMVSFWGDMLIFGGVNLLDFGTLRITKVFRDYPPGGTITYGNSSTQTCLGLGYDDMLVLTGGYLRSTYYNMYPP